MLKSMTGFGRAEQTVNDKTFLVEIKSLNGKQFEMQLRLPPLLKPYEFDIRNILQEQLVRGTIDCMITIKQNGTSRPVNINTDLIKAYYQQIETLAGELNIDTNSVLSALLRLPEVFSRMVTALDRMADKHRFLVAHFARRRMVLDEVDLFLRDLNERIQTVRNLLYNSAESSFALVAIPEALSVNETKRYAAELRADGVSVTDLIINRVEQEHDACVYCAARVASQAPWLKEIEKSFRDLEIHYVPLLAHEVRGLGPLTKISKTIWKSN